MLLIKLPWQRNDTIHSCVEGIPHIRPTLQYNPRLSYWEWNFKNIQTQISIFHSHGLSLSLEVRPSYLISYTAVCLTLLGLGPSLGLLVLLVLTRPDYYHYDYSTICSCDRVVDGKSHQLQLGQSTCFSRVYGFWICIPFSNRFLLPKFPIWRLTYCYLVPLCDINALSIKHIIKVWADFNIKSLLIIYKKYFK